VRANLKKKDLVVAHYREDTRWIHELESEYNVFVYHKDNSLSAREFDRVPVYRREGSILHCDLPNVGRESHTYLYHIVKNYENLAETTAFIQGNPFDHQPALLSMLKNLGERDYHNFSYKVEQQNKFFQEQLDDENFRRVNFFYGNHLSLYRELFDKDLPKKYKVGIHGLFAVPKHLILQNEKSVYLKCLDKFDNSKYFTGFCVGNHGYNPAAMVSEKVMEQYGGMPNGEGFGWMFEYFWDLLFHSEEIVDT